jgi:hypothetical protein
MLSYCCFPYKKLLTKIFVKMKWSISKFSIQSSVTIFWYFEEKPVMCPLTCNLNDYKKSS